MSILDELDALKDRLDHDWDRLTQLQSHMLQTWALAYSANVFEELRKHRPIIAIHKLALVTKHADVVEVMGNDAVFSVRLYDEKLNRTSGPVLLDYPRGPLRDHDLALLHATVSRDDAPRLAQMAAQAIAEFIGPRLPTGRMDLVKDLAHPLPQRIVGAYFGVPAPDDATMTRWCRSIFQDIFANIQNNDIENEAAIQSGREFRAYIEDLIKQRHAEMAAGNLGPDDVLGRWLRRQAAGEDTFDDAHIPNNFIGMMMGALDSIAMAITHVIFELLEHPDQIPGVQAAIAAGDDALLDRYTMEALRFRPQDTVLYRYTEQPYTLAAGADRATEIQEGTMVLLAMHSAMMDEEAVAAPDEFRLDRPADDYLHFGHGLHQCLGRFIATTLVREATKAIFRLDNVRKGEDDVDYDGIYPKSFVITFDPPVTAA